MTRSIQTPIRAILFDMDGVIFDSESLYYDCCFDAAAKHDIELPPDLIKQLSGLSGKLSKEILTPVIAPLDIETFWQSRQEAIEARLAAQGLSFQPDFPEFFERAMETNLPLGLVTSSLSRSVGRNFWHTNPEWLDIFRRIVTFNDVKNTKPDPEPYLKACELLDIKPEEALVIEDSESGATSAINAGTNVILFNTLDTLPAALQPQLVFCSTNYLDIERFLVKADIF